MYLFLQMKFEKLCTDIIDFDESEESPPSLQGTQPATELTSVRTLCDWMAIFLLSRFQTIFYLPDRVMEILLLFLHTFLLLGCFHHLLVSWQKYFLAPYID